MVQRSILEKNLRWASSFTLLFTGLFLAACNGNEKPSGDIYYFLKQTNPGLYVSGNNLFEYNEKECQWAYNKTRKVVRLQKDDQSYYVNMVFSSWPDLLNEDIDVEIDYKTGSQQRKTSFVMILLKSEYGKNWLWNDQTKTGVIFEQ